MSELTFDVLKASWEKLISDRITELRRSNSSLTNPEQIYLKRTAEDNQTIRVQFSGLSKAVDDTSKIPQIKNMIIRWAKAFSDMTQIFRSEPNTIILDISKDLRFSESMTEASVSIFKRDSKSNKIKKAYRCVGGKKHGRRVSSPDQCLGVPDFGKKIKFKVTKNAKYGQSKASKKKTKLTNIVSKRVSKANNRVKKARGF